MGRHSAHRSPSVGAARYVGRVGALAFVLGVGAAVAGGAAASADSTAPDSPDQSTAATTADTTPPGGDSATPGGQVAPKVPRMALGASGGRATTAVADSISTLPQRITSLTGTNDAPGASQVSPGRGTTRSTPKPVATTNVESTNAQSPSTAGPLAPQPDASVASTVGDAPVAPTQSLTGAISLISRDLERAFTTATPNSQTTTGQPTSVVTPVPAPGDVVTTPYGDIGAWMVKTDGDIANWGGQKYFFGTTTLLEPVNIIIIDPDSRTPDESTVKLNAAMDGAGFPALTGHSTGFMGNVLGDYYAQSPANGSDKAYSDNVYILPNNHLRAFGPAPVVADGSQGYVWTGAASTEVPGIYEGTPTHRYASFGLARNILALRMILSGRASFVGVQRMNNVYNEDGISTGDHDGYAIVLRLT